jgi:hypothetical protein
MAVEQPVYSHFPSSQKSPYIEIPVAKRPTLRWNDLPDPTNRQIDPSITQRRVLEIADPRAEKILAENKFRFVPKNYSIIAYLFPPFAALRC